MTNPTPERPETAVPPREPLDPVEAAAMDEMREPPRGEPRTPPPDTEARGAFSFRRMEPWQQWGIGAVAVIVLLLLFVW